MNTENNVQHKFIIALTSSVHEEDLPTQFILSLLESSVLLDQFQLLLIRLLITTSRVKLQYTVLFKYMFHILPIECRTLKSHGTDL